MNRKERRRVEAAQRAQERRLQKDAEERAHRIDRDTKLREIQATGYSAARDPEFRKGVATTVRAIQFRDAGSIGGLCLFRAFAAHQILKLCNQDVSLHIGSLLYRVGPDPVRDVVAFCGRGNAGGYLGDYGAFHVWVEIDGEIADFSVGDWRGLDAGATEAAVGLTSLPPVRWTVKEPAWWWRPRHELVDPWRAIGTPPIGSAWYGPFNGDPMKMANRVKLAFVEDGQTIAEAVENVHAKFADMHGIERPPKETRLFPITPIIETGDASLPAVPPGYQRVMLSEILALAGLSLGNVPDAVTYVSAMPTTQDEARTLLRNMSMTAPR